MKCRTFSIRIGPPEHTAADEATVDDFLGSVSMKRIYAALAGENHMAWSVLVFYEDKRSDEPETQDEIALTPEEELRYEDLRIWRNERAIQEGLAPYMIAHNTWLKLMVKMPARTVEDLLRVKGFGERRTAKYGDEILSILAASDRAGRAARP